MVSIAVQPPTHAMVSDTLHPPLIVRCHLDGTTVTESNVAYTMTQLVLFDASGNALFTGMENGDDYLSGGFVEDRDPTRGEASTAASPSSIYYIWPNIRINRLGVFTIRVYLRIIDNNSGTATVIAIAETRSITVVDKNVAKGRLCEYLLSTSPCYGQILGLTRT